MPGRPEGAPRQIGISVDADPDLFYAVHLDGLRFRLALAAVGDGPIDRLRLEGLVETDEILAGHLGDRLFGGGLMRGGLVCMRGAHRQLLTWLHGGGLQRVVRLQGFNWDLEALTDGKGVVPFNDHVGIGDGVVVSLGMGAGPRVGGAGCRRREHPSQCEGGFGSGQRGEDASWVRFGLRRMHGAFLLERRNPGKR